ncbi:MAG: hypothetical protein H0U74_18215 [Bradymonadaceae bacterium]|nr:hypothetical protein [Lujinxingiaceae bacterium]
MLQRRNLIAAILLGSALIFGCALPADDCKEDSDCFVGERCVRGDCLPPATNNTTNPNNTTTNNTTTNNTIPDQDTGDDYQDTTPIIPPPEPVSCIVDRLTLCEDPSGELKAAQIESSLTNSVSDPGNPQQHFDRQFCNSYAEPGALRQEKVYVDMLCPAEPADYYRFDIPHCGDRDTFLEVTLTTEPACFIAQFDLLAELSTSAAPAVRVPTPCSATNPCSERLPHTYTRKFLLPANALERTNFYIGVVSTEQNTMFKYTLSARLRYL